MFSPQTLMRSIGKKAVMTPMLAWKSSEFTPYHAVSTIKIGHFLVDTKSSEIKVPSPEISAFLEKIKFCINKNQLSKANQRKWIELFRKQKRKWSFSEHFELISLQKGTFWIHRFWYWVPSKQVKSRPLNLKHFLAKKEKYLEFHFNCL